MKNLRACCVIAGMTRHPCGNAERSTFQRGPPVKPGGRITSCDIIAAAPARIGASKAARRANEQEGAGHCGVSAAVL